MKKSLLAACLFGTLSHVSAADAETVGVTQDLAAGGPQTVRVTETDDAGAITPLTVNPVALTRTPTLAGRLNPVRDCSRISR